MSASMDARATETIGVCVLAGGAATRLPGKLALDAGDVPMLARTVRNVCAGRDTWLSTNGALPSELAHHLSDLPQVVDRWPARGPLSGLVSTLSAMPHAWVFVVAGDAPFVDTVLIDALATAIGDEHYAIVPVHGGAVEPLAALYRREPFLKESMHVLLDGGGPRAVIDRLRPRFVPIDDARTFVNVNTPGDYARIREALA